MKLRLSILLLAAAALAAAPAAGQTIKSLGYNTTNGNIVAATNVTFTNSVGFATNARAATRTNLGGTTVGNAVFTATNAAAAATAIGLGTTNSPTFRGLTLDGGTNSLFDEVSLSMLNADGPWSIFSIPSADNPPFDMVGQELRWGSLYVRNDGRVYQKIGGAINGPSEWGKLLYLDADGGATNARSSLGLATTNNVTFSNITASGTLTATGNATLNGSDNLMPNAITASSASSLMTRDLVGQEFANPRNRMQTTYWFGLQGLGEWSLIGSGALSGYVALNPGFGGGRAWYSSHMVGTNHAGAGLRLGNDTLFGPGQYRFFDGGPLTMRGRIRRHDTIGVPALAFVMGERLATQMWQQNAYGLYFVPQPTNSWASNAVATQHDRISVSNVVWAVNTTGTNAATEPTWTDLIGSLVTNGSAVYRNLGPHTSNNWVLAIGSTNASQVVMTNTGKAGLGRNGRSEVVLTLRIDGTTNTPYTVYGSVENNTGESSEVSLTTTNNDTRQPQFWNRADDLGTRTNSVYDLFIKYFSIDGTLNPL
jgi:hypothetical protein